MALGSPDTLQEQGERSTDAHVHSALILQSVQLTDSLQGLAEEAARAFYCLSAIKVTNAGLLGLFSLPFKCNNFPVHKMPGHSFSAASLPSAWCCCGARPWADRMSYKVTLSAPSHTKVLAPFSRLRGSSEGPQQSRDPRMGVCLGREVVFCREPNVFLTGRLAAFLSPSLLLHKTPWI